jgi:DNA-binding transcriptional MocR family regulator
MTTISRRSIDFLKGWPHPSLLTPKLLQSASAKVLSEPLKVTTEILEYGDDEGYLPLRQSLANWLTKFYAPQESINIKRITISGGASQNLACVLQTFTDPIYTRNVWMVAPAYYLAFRIFNDSGFEGRLKAVPEDDEGVDIDFLRSRIQQSEQQAIDEGNSEPVRAHEPVCRASQLTAAENQRSPAMAQDFQAHHLCRSLIQ